MGWQGRCFRRGHRIRKREKWLWYQILPEAWSHTKKMKQNYKCKTDTHMAQTEHHKYSICIPSGCTSAPHIKKRARNGHQKYIKNWWSGDLQLWILRICHYDIIPDLITPEHSCFLLLTLLVMFLVGAIYWFSISLATFYQSDNILLKVQLHCQ